MPYQIKLPDGSLAWIADDVPQSKALELAKGAYPDAFPPPPGVVSQLISAPKEFVKGAASGLVQAAGGLGALPYAGARYFMPELKPFEETGFGKQIVSAEKYLAPSDEGVVTQLAGGLGSFASILGPQVALRGLGAAGRFAGMAPRAATPVGVAQTMGLGTEEARQRVEVARGDKIDVTPGQELGSLAVGAGIGLTELLPVQRLFKGIDKTLSGDVQLTIANYIKRALAQGGIEGAQEAAAGLMQDLSAKGIYNPDLEVGKSMLSDAALGGGVGALAQTGLDFILRKDIGRAYQARIGRESQQKINAELERLQQEQDLKNEQTRKGLGVPDPNILALPAPAPKVEPIVERDPLMNPVGFFNADELSPAYLRAVNDIRKSEGKRGISQFSVEDLADAGAPQAELDRLLSYKTGYDGKTQLSADDVLNVASQKNVDTATVGFMDFLRRATGAEDLTAMSQPQLFSAFKALDGLPPSEQTQILPPGTNATRFSEDQYSKAVKGLSDFFPKNNMVSRDKAIQEIKDYSGLESDRDAESLLQTAIKNGDLTTVGRTVYEVAPEGDATTPAIRRYTSLQAAESAAQRIGASQGVSLAVRERVHQDVALPGSAARLPGGPDIRQGTFKQGTAPAGFEIRSPDAVLQTATSQEDAEAKAERLAQLREQKANGFLGGIAKKEAEMQKSQRKLESMEADGKADTFEYKKIAAGVAAQNKRLLNDINALKAKVQNYTAPLEIAPKGEKPVTRTGFTLFERGQPVATFPTQQAAEETALLNLPNETLERIAQLAPSQKGLMPKRLGKLAEEVLRLRKSSDPTVPKLLREPTGFGIPITGSRAEAEAKLQAAGVFTPEFRKAAAELDKKLRPMMERLGLGDLRLNIMKAIRAADGSEADGYYLQRVIAVALDSENPVRTLRHEGIHALKELGAFTPEQWRVLENKAKSEWLSKYNIEGRYQGLNLSQDEMIEEAIADAFSDFDQTKAPPGLIGSLFGKIKQFMNALGNALRGMGFQTAEGIFERTEAGGLKPISAEEVGGKPKYQLPRVMSNGRIVGAPPGKDTAQDRTQLVRRLNNLLSHPFALYERSKEWYEESGAAIREFTRGNPALTERTIRLVALYSQSNNVGGNTTATIKSIAALADGSPTAYAGRFPNTTAARIPALLAAPTMDSSLPGVDDKLMNFYRDLHDATYGTDLFSGSSTIDRWMMRLLGYPHAEDQERGGATGVSNTQYIYAKDIMRRVAEANARRKGEVLKPRQVQAVLWTYVKNLSDYNELSPEKQAKFVPTTKNFNDYVVRATANITWESRPSTSLPLIPGIHKAPRDEQEAFNRAVRSIFIDPETGEDKIFKLLGNQQLYSSQFSVGGYENLVTPNIISRLVLQKDDKGYLTSVADQYAAIVGYVTKQDAVPWYRADPTAEGAQASRGYRVTATNATPDIAFEDKLFKHLSNKIPGIGFSRIDDSFDFINFRGEDGNPYLMPDKAFIAKLQEALSSFDANVNFDVDEFRTQSGWISNNWKENPDGQGYLERFSPEQLSDLRRLLDGWSADYNGIAAAFGKEYGWDKPAKFSLRSGREGDGISLGARQPGAVTVDAVHYGKANTPELQGSKYGTGIRGAERRRLDQSYDDRIRRRVYFYIPKEDETMSAPESGLGNHVYIQRFNNILGPGPEMTSIKESVRGDANSFESAVVDAGYDGYAVPSMGMMVILNHDVPVEYRGTREEVRQRPESESVPIGDKRYALRNAQWDEKRIDKLINEFGYTDGRSKAYAANINPDDFVAATTLSQEEYEKIYKEAGELDRAKLADETQTPFLYVETKNKKWEIVGHEGRHRMAAMNRAGVDSVPVVLVMYKDGGRHPAMYAPKENEALRGQKFYENSRGKPTSVSNLIPLAYQYKDDLNQAFGGEGEVKFALRQTETPEFKRWFGDSKIVTSRDVGLVTGEAIMEWLGIPEGKHDKYWRGLDQEERERLTNDYRNRNGVGKPKVMYHGTSRDIQEFLGKQAGAIFVTDDPVFAEGFAEMSANWIAKNEGDSFPQDIKNKVAEDVIKKIRVSKIPPLAKPEAAQNIRDWAQGKISLKDGQISDNAYFYLTNALVDYVPTGQNIVPVYVRAENPFDYENEDHLAKLAKTYKTLQTAKFPIQVPGMKIKPLPLEEIEEGRWSVIESPDVQDAIKKSGFDGFYIEESGRKNLAVYDPNQLKSATGNTGAFSREDKRIQYSLRSNLPQDTIDAIERTTTARQEKGFAQRMAEAISPTAFKAFRQAHINKYEAIEQQSKEIARQFGSKELLADTSAIASALFADRAAGVAASSYKNGVPVYRNGFTTVSDLNGSVKGLIPILEPLMKYNDPFVFQAFQFYAATRRGARLTAEGREQLLTQKDLSQGNLLGQKYPEFKTVFDEYQKYNKGLVDFMKDTGVISDKEAVIWTQNWDYIPFYRQMDGEDTAGPRVFSPISGVNKPKKLKGGEAPLADFMETIVRNSRAAIEAGMKNVAGQRVVRDMLRLNQGQEVPAALARGSDVVTVKENGQTKYYKVDDPLLVEALKGLNLPQLPFMEVLAAPSNLLRNLVTKEPGFMLANLIRDSLSSWVTTGTNITPIVDTFKQFGTTLAGRSPEAQALANAGLFAGYDFASDVKASAREVASELRKRTGQRTAQERALMPVSAIWGALEKGSAASDVATRAEVYKRTLAETGNEAEAMLQALEVLNFSRKGNSALIRVLTALVPFMNARIQGLDVMYRSGFGKAATQNKERMQKAFITRSMTLMGLSWMYWMLASDTEEYKTAEQEVRDNNWIIGSVKIPIPFEIGTLFKVFPERILEYFMGQDTSKDLKDSIIRNITSTLAINPIPQAFLPVVENVANYSFFTGQPIVGKGLQDVAPKYQVGANTSILAQDIGKATNTSPVQIDNLIRGYTGTLGTYMGMAIDFVMRGEGDPPKATMTAEQMPVIKRFYASPESTGTISAYYEMKKAVDESTRTINFLERTAKPEDLMEYLQDKGAKLQAVKPLIQTIDKDMTMLREMRRTVQVSGMDSDRKREVLDNIRKAEVAMTSRIQFLKKSLD